MDFKTKTKKLMEKGKKWTGEHNSDILTGGVIIGLLTSLYLMYKATPKVNEALDKRKEELVSVTNEAAKKQINKVTVKRIIKATAPVVISAGATVACAIGSNRSASKKIALLSAAYNLANNTAKDLSNKMNEVLGDKKAKEIKDAIAKEKVGKAPKEPSTNGTQVVVGDGLVLCKDLFSGRFFKSNMQRLQDAKNKCCAMAMREGSVTVNDFYDIVNAPGLDRVDMGDELMWNDEAALSGSLDIEFSSILTNDGQPCIAITLSGLRAATY